MLSNKSTCAIYALNRQINRAHHDVFCGGGVLSHAKLEQVYFPYAFICGYFAFAYLFFLGQSFIPLEDGIFNPTSVIWGLSMGLIALAVLKSKYCRSPFACLPIPPFMFF